jgi:hypothetical protein
MPNRWNKRDFLRLTRDCELGRSGDQLHVTSASGPYMTVRRPDGSLAHTGRDYAFATKIGEGAVDRADDADDGPFSRIGDALTACHARLCVVERRMRAIPTARRSAIRLAEVLDRLEEIGEEFASTDHAGGP